MIIIENNFLKVQIDERGAKVCSIIDLDTGYEYLWQEKSSPDSHFASVLFPVVGSLQDGHFFHEGKFYKLDHKGLVWNRQFFLQHHTQNSASFCLKSDAETLKSYPFDFSLQVNFVLYERQLTVSFEVLNPSKEEPLYYGIGYQSLFKLSHTRGRNYPEYDQVTYQLRPAGHFYQLFLTEDGLIDNDKARYSEYSQQALLHKLFRNDEMILQIHQSVELSLFNETDKQNLTWRGNAFDYLSLWSPYPKRYPFVRLASWSGLPDVARDPQLFKNKRGNNYIAPQSISTHDLTFEFYPKQESK